MERSHKVAQAQALTPTANPFLPASASSFAANAFAVSNPFADKPRAAAEVPADAPEGSYTYALVKNGPDVDPAECEIAASAVEIMILWGSSVLHVAHLTPPRSFYVGEEGCDYMLPAEKLGAARMPVIVAGPDGSVSMIIPSNAHGTLEIAGQSMTVREAVESGRTQDFADFAGARQIALPAGSKAKVDIGGIVLQVATVNAGRAVSADLGVDTKALPYHGLSMALHAGLLAAAALLVPPLGANDDGSITADQRYLIQAALGVPEAERNIEPQREDTPVANPTPNNGGRSGDRAMGSEGTMGSQTSTRTGGRFGIAGPIDNPDPQIARQRALADAAQFGMIGLLNTGIGGDPNAPTSPWGGDFSLGNDPRSALGSMWGNTLDDSAGSGGLGLTGTGEGGGGRGVGVGIDNIGTIGGGFGGPGGIGGRNFANRQHRTGSPIMRSTGAVVDGKLPAEIIQRIVRQNFGRYRFCYQDGLRNNPSLAGRVAVRFVIGRDGAVSNVANGGSDLPDPSVVSCVVRGFYGLSFPAPEHGIVTVTYPLMFSPG
jgi:hypothetical protein